MALETEIKMQQADIQQNPYANVQIKQQQQNVYRN